MEERLKILWEKEEMLVTSIFSFFPQCFQKASFSGSLKARTVRLKTLWEKEKKLVTSIFLFPTTFSEGLFLNVVKSQDCAVELRCLPFPKQALVFTCLQYTFIENTV